MRACVCKTRTLAQRDFVCSDIEAFGSVFSGFLLWSPTDPIMSVHILSTDNNILLPTICVYPVHILHAAFVSTHLAWFDWRIIHSHKVRWYPVTPPQLPWDAPVPETQKVLLHTEKTPAEYSWAEIDGSPDVVHPVEPGFEVVVRDDLELSASDDICGLLSHLSAVHVPLRLQKRLHYVLRTAEKHILKTFIHVNITAVMSIPGLDGIST